MAEQVLGHKEACSPVINAYHVESASSWISINVAIQKHDGNSRFRERIDHPLVHAIHPLGEFQRRKEDSCNPAVQIVFAKIPGTLFAIGFGVGGGMRGVTPEQGMSSVSPSPRHALANRFKNLRFAKTGDQQTKYVLTSSLVAPDVCARSGPAFDQRLVLKFFQRALNREPGSREAFDQVGLAWQPLSFL